MASMVNRSSGELYLTAFDSTSVFMTFHYLIYSFEEGGKMVNPHTPSSMSKTCKNQFTSPTSDAMSMSDQRSSVLSKRDRKRYRKDFPHVKNQEVFPSQKPIAITGSSGITRRRSVQGAFVGPKGNNTELQDRYRTACLGQSLEKEELEVLSDKELVTYHDLEYDRKVVLGKTSQGFTTLEKKSDESNSEVQPKENNFETAKKEFETKGSSSGVLGGGNKKRNFIQAVRNRVILPIRLQKQTSRLNKRSDFVAHCERSFTFGEDVLKEDKFMEQNEENDVYKTAKVTPLSAGKLQKLIRENVLSQSQAKSTKANPKTVVLADYVRTLQMYMGITDSVFPESKSPDFSATPFIATARKFGGEDGREDPPTGMQRRLEMLQEQLVRLPSTFTLLDGDLVED